MGVHPKRAPSWAERPLVSPQAAALSNAQPSRMNRRDEAEAARPPALTSVLRAFVDRARWWSTSGSRDATSRESRGSDGATVHTIPGPGPLPRPRKLGPGLVNAIGCWCSIASTSNSPEAWEPWTLMAQPDLLLITCCRFERGAKQSPYSRVSRLFPAPSRTSAGAARLPRDGGRQRLALVPPRSPIGRNCRLAPQPPSLP